MPELPEVEVVRQQLSNRVTGRTVEDIKIRDWKSVRGDRHFISQTVGQTITAIDRTGKYLIFTLSDEDSYLICHLRMTGRLIFVPSESDTQIGGGHKLPEGRKSQPHEHTRIIFTFSNDAHLYFNDMRKFGYIRRADVDEVKNQRSKLGPEPLTADYTTDVLKNVLKDRKTSLKAALLKQSDIAGLGNIYVDEACWRAGIRPDSTAGSLGSQDTQALYDATQSVLADALSYGGTTIDGFADTNGAAGNFSDRLAVFGREGEPCRRCGHTVEKIRTAGRGTHLCPECQVNTAEK